MPSIRDFLNRATPTPAGNTFTHSPASDSGNRQGVWISNLDASLYLYVRFKGSTESAPAGVPGATDKDAALAPLETRFFDVGGDVGVYLFNSSGAATTSNAVVRETV